MQGILFNEETGMLAATIAGTKTMTRRICNPQPIIDNESGYVFWKNKFQFDIHNWKDPFVDTCARYKVDEIVYIKEAHQKYLAPGIHNIYEDGIRYNYVYRVDAKGSRREQEWSNPMFAGKDSARHFIKILSVKVEQLKHITEEECIKEGIILNNKPHEGWYWQENIYCTNNPRKAFEKVIGYINGKCTWENNPWVFVYEFEKVCQ